MLKMRQKSVAMVNLRSAWRYNIRRCWPLYLMAAPGIVYLRLQLAET